VWPDGALTVQTGHPVFSRASAAQRIAALLDEGERALLHRAGQVVTARGCLAGRPVCVAASDPSGSHGAIGTQEAGALVALLEEAQRLREPVVLVLDSAGANVEQGLAALGAFRRLFRAALAARMADLPMLALLGRSCFGGASMLACLCQARSYLPQTRLATSGPAVIEGASGKAQFDATDARAVTDLIGSAGRVTLNAQDAVREDALDAARAAVEAFLANRPAGGSLAERHAHLGARLRSAGVEASDASVDRAALVALLPPGYQPDVHGSVFCARPQAGSGRAVFCGALGGTPIGAAACWQLADWLLAVEGLHRGSPVVLALDADGHAASVSDERALLSDYLVHLSCIIAHLAGRGHRAVLWIPGCASGASYVAFAAPVERVSALPSAQIAVLPARAVRQILGERAQAGSTDWFETGVADALLDSRLAGYAAVREGSR
jgi:hypothetical protein